MSEMTMQQTPLGSTAECREQLLGGLLGLDFQSTPFPWQLDLLERMRAGKLAQAGALDIPTGLGKTATMAVWLLARALGAPVPRRLVYVVDRRAVVDQATTEAERLREQIDASEELKEALGIEGSLAISTLRGQHADNRRWLEDPCSPAIIVGTVDMVGSRLLFEGYGVSDKMRPYHAGLMGADTLLVLDEAHLVPPFEALVRAIATETDRFGAGSPERGVIVPGFMMLSLSATGRGDEEGIGLTEADHAHPVVARRFNADKRLTIEELESDASLPDELVSRAWALADQGKSRRRIVIFCNSRKDALKVQKGLSVLLGKSTTQTELLVGARRVFEREAAAQRLADLGFLAGSTSRQESPSFLIATAAGEVGVDVDADHMVCDLVPWERMVQRMGRVNRRGEGAAEVIVLVELPKKSPAVVRALAMSTDARSDSEVKALEKYERLSGRANVLRQPLLLLRTHSRRNSIEGAKHHDASPAAISELKERSAHEAKVEALLQRATTPAPLRPELTRAVVDAWSMTSLESHPARPDIQPWLRGWEDDDPQVTLVWRSHLPIGSSASSEEHNDEKGALNQAMGKFFEAAPPHLLEKLEADLPAFRAWAEKRAKAVPSARLILTARRRKTRSFTLEELVRKLKDKRGYSLAGLTIVLPKEAGGLSNSGLLDASLDGSCIALDDQTVDAGALEFPFRVGRERLDDNLVNGQIEKTPQEVGIWAERHRFSCERGEDGADKEVLIVEHRRNENETEEDRSSGSKEQSLEEHQQWAQTKAERLGQRAGLPPEVRKVLSLAALVHDEGKAAARWQSAFQAPKAGRPYAKTRGPILQGILGGYRHELGSYLQMLEDERFVELRDDLRDLALHLVVSHHGGARPMIETAGCDLPPSALETHSRDIAERFSSLQRKWGPWGLAWLEALLRAADQQASRENNEGLR